MTLSQLRRRASKYPKIEIQRACHPDKGKNYYMVYYLETLGTVKTEPMTFAEVEAALDYRDKWDRVCRERGLI